MSVFDVKQVAIIGLGRFGGSVHKELYNNGHEVLAIDIQEDKVNEVIQAVQADTMDEKALQSLGSKNFDLVVIAIDDDIQASTLTTLILNGFNIPKVWVKAQNLYHQKMLKKIGMDQIIHPEYEIGIRIAQSITSENVVDFINHSEDYGIVEVRAIEKIHQQTLVELNVRAEIGITILAVKHHKDINVSPMLEDIIYKEDLLIIVGNKNDIRWFEKGGDIV